MRKPGLLVALLCFLCMSHAFAGEPLVVKTADGKFVPAVAKEWAAFGKAFRFVLKAGTKAPEVAAELKSRIAPIQVEAPDEFTLVFKGQGLTEATLLEKLSGIQLGKDKPAGDALAALSDLGESGSPALSDLSSAGSIRASKKFDLHAKKERKVDPANLVGKVVQVHDCEPLPTVIIEVLAVPSKGPHMKAFKTGQKMAIRGYYKITDDTKKIDPTDKRTQINLKTAGLKPGNQVFGKPFIKDGEVWVLQTIEKK
jgi:hypothetical protein